MMRRRDRVLSVASLVIAFLAVGLPAANAYVDPGAGSFIFQAVVGGLLAGALALKVFWRRLLRLVTQRGRNAEPQDAPEPAAVRDD